MNGCLIDVDETNFFAIMTCLLAQIIEPLPEGLNLNDDSKTCLLPNYIQFFEARIRLQNITIFMLQRFQCNDSIYLR